jgi:uncharacterized protein
VSARASSYASPAVLDVETPHGLARAHLHSAAGARGALILGHGAGGGVGARDLTAVRDAALSERISVALVEQPYRVAGRRSPAPARQLDGAWTVVVERLRDEAFEGGPLLVGGRSAGARVACRTAAAVGARGVLCLAFPVLPPRSKPGAESRQVELDAVTVPVLVIQGKADPFGVPTPGPGREVVTVPGTHSLSADLDAVGDAAQEWLGRQLR